MDEISKELLLGLTWHHPGEPSLEARSPSGIVFSDGQNGAFEIGVGWMTALHIPAPEPGTWRVKVAGDPHYRPLRMNLMARSVCPEFDIHLQVDPFLLKLSESSLVVATPIFDGKTAKGRFEAVLSDFAGNSWKMKMRDDGSLVAKPNFTIPGVMPLRVELKGELKGKRRVERMEFTTVQVGRPKDPRLTVAPDRFQVGRRYQVEVAINDGRFSAATQIRFGAGIEVKGFTVLSDFAAVAEIAVATDAVPGAREVLTYQPDAETLTGIVIEGGRDGAQPGFGGYIKALRFNERGRLIAVVLDSGEAITVARHAGCLQKLLESARDKNHEVSIRVDDEGEFYEVSIGV